MRIVEINSMNFGSTGNIMLQIAEVARKRAHQVYICCPKSRDNSKRNVENQIIIGNRITRNLHLQLAKWTGLNGCFSIVSTIAFLRKIDAIEPDVIHLHNLHNCYINIPILFGYLKKRKVRVIWTFHDCWPFTGGCACFTAAKCNKWKTGCFSCTQHHLYPESNVDLTRVMWKQKKKWFSGIQDLTIVTPSDWLCALVKESFLGCYPVNVINNGIDLDIFKPRKSSFREKNHCTSQFVILGVALGWGNRKGLDVFVKLAECLDSHYQIVLVGTDNEVDKLLPDNIISVHRTRNQIELAEIYSAADLFVNPTREENYPTVNMEAIACGTPVLTFRTGGSPEILNESTGSVVECDDFEALINKIEDYKQSFSASPEVFADYAKRFDKDEKFMRYIALYEKKNM